MTALDSSRFEKLAVGYLAGGQARRLGGIDKAFIEIGGQTIFERQRGVLADIPVQILNANGDVSRFDATGLKVIPDTHQGHLGPLAGLLSLMAEVRSHHPKITHILSIATDAPFIPDDMAEQLLAEQDKTGADIVMAASFGRHHPVFALWPVMLADALESALIEEGIRKIDHFTASYHVELVDFTPSETASQGLRACDPFMNINRPEDIAAAERLLSQAGTEE